MATGLPGETFSISGLWFFGLVGCLWQARPAIHGTSAKNRKLRIMCFIEASGMGLRKDWICCPDKMTGKRGRAISIDFG
jgi:hypothetical protein